MAVQWFVRLGAFGMALLFAAPALAQKPTEPPARRAAALADFRQTCGPLIGPYNEFRRINGLSGAAPDDHFLAERDGATTYYAADQYGLAVEQALRIRVRNASQIDNPGHRLVKCAAEVALRHALNGVPGYDYGASASRPSAPAPRPNVAARPAPAPLAKKLPPARPAKMQAWSPKAMSIDPAKALSPIYAAERADALASCAAAIKQWSTASTVLSPAEASLALEEKWLNDKEDMSLNADQVRNYIAVVEKQISAGNLDASTLAARRAGRCLYQRRLAQLEGSPLATGAVEGTLTPLSIGGSSAPPSPGKDAHIIASDGKSAMDCVSLEQVASGDSAVSGGGRRFVNRCSDEVEITWCNTPGCSKPTGGNTWTVKPGNGWPVSSEGVVRFAACHGRDTASFVKGSHGLRYYCKAPANK